jgi:O-antigen/teichoic acid export membrane protein
MENIENMENTESIEEMEEGENIGGTESIKGIEGEEVNEALHKVAKGTGIIFLGTIFSLLFAFFSRVAIARAYSISEYGVFSLALTVLSIALVIATLGFFEGMPREIAFYREREPSRVREILSTSIAITAASSLVFLALMFFSSDAIARFFRQEELSLSIKILAFALPFTGIARTMIAAYRGFGSAKEMAYFQNIMPNLLFLVFIIPLAVLSLPFVSVFYAYLAAQMLTFSALIIHNFRSGFEVGFETRTGINLQVGKNLLFFSLHLLFTNILALIMTWTDTLMLGYYKSAESVGLYNAALPLARLIPLFLGSAGFMYVPVASQLFAQGKLREMGRTYQILTKWIFLLTLPIFGIMFLFPEATINFLFGNRYLAASQALRILALGFIFHTFLGLNGLSLIVIKETRFIMLSNLFGAVSNVLLNALLIPFYGVLGAAVASVVSYTLINTMYSLRLYQKTEIHPFSWNYIKPLTISFILLMTIQIYISPIVSSFWLALIVLIGFLLVYAILVLLSKSVDKEDVELFLAMEERLGMDLKVVKKLLRRLV